MEQQTKTYQTLAAFKWGDGWLAANEEIQLLDCEATALIHTQKIAKLKQKPTKGKRSDATN